MSDARELANCSFTGITHILDAVSNLHMSYIASRSCFRSHIATTKQNKSTNKLTSKTILRCTPCVNKVGQ